MLLDVPDPSLLVPESLGGVVPAQLLDQLAGPGMDKKEFLLVKKWGKRFTNTKTQDQKQEHRKSKNKKKQQEKTILGYVWDMLQKLKIFSICIKKRFLPPLPHLPVMFLGKSMASMPLRMML